MLVARVIVALRSASFSNYGWTAILTFTVRTWHVRCLIHMFDTCFQLFCVIRTTYLQAAPAVLLIRILLTSIATALPITAARPPTLRPYIVASWVHTASIISDALKVNRDLHKPIYAPVNIRRMVATGYADL